MTKRQVTRRGALLLAALLGIGLPVMVPALGADEEREPERAARALPVAALRVNLVHSYTEERAFTGELHPRRSAELGFEQAGRLVAIEVQEGDRVEADQPLAQLDDRRLAARRAQLAAERDGAAALLAELEAGPRAQTIASAEAEVNSSQQLLELARVRTDRRDELFAKSAVAGEELDAARFTQKSLAAQLAGAQARLDELREGTRAERLAAQRAVVAGLDAALDAIDVDLDDARLTAPFAGTVARRAADEGDVVQPGEMLLTLVEDSHLEAWIGVPVEAAHELEPGQPRELTIAGRDYAAQVRSVLPELEPGSRTARVILDLEPAAAEFLLPGQIARLALSERIELGEQGGTWLPVSALGRGARGLWSVYSLEAADPSIDPEGYRPVRRDVEVLHVSGELALVRGSLTAGELVLPTGGHRVAPGQAVHVASLL